ncbi:MAG: hypothetical protein E7220_02855 [Clostridiales bacterium]|nr:hypothetical protein [Clostridiales bacterium]
MPEFKVVEGRLSEYYDHFSEYEFMSCTAVDTRLMGVLAFKITWKGISKPRARFYQVIHLDYSEYGIDDYTEFECIPGTEDYKDRKEAMNWQWNHFTGVMGGEIRNVTAGVMLKLIDQALPLADDSIDREYDNRTNSDFRHYAVTRLEMMKSVLISRGVDPETISMEDAMLAVSPSKLGRCEIINYFIMRLIDHDYDAACLLTSMDRGELSRNELAAPGIQTLIRSNITRSNQKKDPPADGISSPYRVKITTLARNGYYHSSFVIWLNEKNDTYYHRVSDIVVGSSVKLSDYESAIQVTRKEYITVFDCPDKILYGFNGNMIQPLSGVDPEPVPNGWLYTIFKKDNSHVNKADYRLGDDVFGYALLSLSGQLILMSNDMNAITTLDNATMFSLYAPDLTIRGRYLLERTPVFHTLCHTQGVLFEDIIMPIPDD